MSRDPRPRRLTSALLLGLLGAIGISVSTAAAAPASAASAPAQPAPAASTAHVTTHAVASASEPGRATDPASSGMGTTRLDAAATHALLPAAKNMKSLSVDDTAGVLSEKRLKAALDGVKFHKPTKVVVYTRNGEYSDSLNTKTLDYARSDHPEWISQDPRDDGDFWADGIFIVSLSVESGNHGQIGTYFGEDRALDDKKMEKVHAAGTENFRLGRWTDGIADVIKEGAKLINRPWYQSPTLWFWVIGLIAVAGIAVSVWLSNRATQRRQFDSDLASGVRHVAQVATDLDTTELSARTLPTDSPHAADLERRFEDFMQQFRKTYTEQQELQAIDPKHRHHSDYRQRAKDFAEAGEDLDFTDDAIIQAAALYTRSATWQDAWRAQTAPLIEDLDRLDSLTGSRRVPLRDASPALASFREEARTTLETVSSDLEAQRIDVDQALDALADLRKELTDQLQQHSEEQIAKYAKTAEEEATMREQMSSARHGARRRGTGSILDATTPANYFWRVAAYQMGYNAGHSQVEHNRSAASASSHSGGISHGYSGGGSFSGSGGSSRF